MQSRRDLCCKNVSEALILLAYSPNFPLPLYTVPEKKRIAFPLALVLVSSSNRILSRKIPMLFPTVSWPKVFSVQLEIDTGIELKEKRKMGERKSAFKALMSMMEMTFSSQGVLLPVESSRVESIKRCCYDPLP